MSKDNEGPKTLPRPKQGDLFKTEGVANRTVGVGTSRREKRAELSSCLADQRALTMRIMDKITDYGSLGKAFQQVKRNQGSGGVDGMTLEDYEANQTKHISTLHEQLRQERYIPQEVKLVEIGHESDGHPMVRRAGTTLSGRDPSG